MKFTLTIELGNEAMQTALDVRSAILYSVRPNFEPMELGEMGSILDLNGNTVGQWSVTE